MGVISNAARAPTQDEQQVLEMGGGDICTTLRMWLRPLNCTLKMLKTVNTILCMCHQTQNMNKEKSQSTYLQNLVILLLKLQRQRLFLFLVQRLCLFMLKFVYHFFFMKSSFLFTFKFTLHKSTLQTTKNAIKL